MKIIRATLEAFDEQLDQLVEILQHTVNNGAAVGFIAPLSAERATQFWQETIRPAVASGDRALFLALEEGRAVGTAQLILGMPDNQPHRGEVSKMMVHPDHRRKGIAHQLIARLEEEARAHDRWQITLDTRSGGGAEPFYHRMGYKVAGIIPNFGKNATDDAFHATTYMYKTLDERRCQQAG